VVKQATKLVTPTKVEEETLRRVSEQVISLLEDAFEKANAETRPEISVGGSYAKGTWLRDEADIDYFLRYPVDYPREKLEGEAIEIASRAVKRFEVNMRFAEHPYVEAFVEKTRINLVPCYKVAKGEWQSAADRSPFHTEYVRSHVDSKLRLEIRLLKKFVKGAQVYGAEVRTQGFSGYVCEVLVLKYGSFEGALNAISNVSKREVISIEPYDNELAASFQSALVILDPIDTTRNLGTAISGENAARLILRGRSFLSKPGVGYFSEPRRVGKETSIREELLDRALVLTFRNGERSPDILWGQLRKSTVAISKRLELMGFEVLRGMPLSDDGRRSALVFLLHESKISKFQVRKGPEVYRRKDSDQYLTKNRGRFKLSWIAEDGRINSIFERDANSTDAFLGLKDLLSNRKKAGTIGLSRAIQGEIGRGFALKSGSEVLVNRDKPNEWLRDGVSSIIQSETGL
jgi:tRNA nucleotidyltransferase (CCA-adding enzyme)